MMILRGKAQERSSGQGQSGLTKAVKLRKFFIRNFRVSLWNLAFFLQGEHMRGTKIGATELKIW